jgi:hypothetical protein
VSVDVMVQPSARVVRRSRAMASRSAMQPESVRFPVMRYQTALMHC